MTSVFSVSASDWRMVFERSTATVEVDVAGQRRRRAAAVRRCTPSTASMMFAPGWRDRTTATPGLPLTRPALRRSSTEVDDFGDVGEPDRRAVAIGDHEIAILGGVRRLIVGVDLIVEVVVLDRALRAVGVGGGERRADVLEADAVMEDRARIDLDAHRGQRRCRRRRPRRCRRAGTAAAAGRWRRGRRAGPAVRVVDDIARTMIGASAGLTLW